jgi:hypothetical protein
MTANTIVFFYGFVAMKKAMTTIVTFLFSLLDKKKITNTLNL